MNELTGKKYLVTAEIVRAEGWQTLIVVAPNAKEAVRLAEAGEGAFYTEEIEVLKMGAFQCEGEMEAVPCGTAREYTLHECSACPNCMYLDSDSRGNPILPACCYDQGSGEDEPRRFDDPSEPPGDIPSWCPLPVHSK